MGRSKSFTRSQEIEIRVISAAESYLQKPAATLRSTATLLDVSKSTIHTDFRDRLPHINSELAIRVAKKIDNNLEDRARRGGLSSARNRGM